MEDVSDEDDALIEENDEEELDGNDALGDDDICEAESDQNSSTDEEEEWSGISENTAVADKDSTTAEPATEAPSGKHSIAKIWFGTESTL